MSWTASPSTPPGIDDLDSIVVHGIRLAEVQVSIRHLKTEYLARTPDEDVQLSLDFANEITPFFTAIYSMLQKKYSDSTAVMMMRRGDPWHIICHGEAQLEDHHRAVSHLFLKLEIYLWTIHPPWRIVSKPWSQVPTVLTSKQLSMIDRGYMNKVLSGHIRIDPAIHECGAELNWLISQLSGCSFFVTSDSDTPTFGKVDGATAQGDELCLLTDYPVPALLRPDQQQSFQIVGFAHCHEEVCLERERDGYLVVDYDVSISSSQGSGGASLKGWKKDKRNSAWEHVKDRPVVSRKLV